jgi:signal transduction histidine kinase
VWQSGVEIERVIRNLADGVTVQDATGRLVWANEAAARACLAASVEELLSTPVAEIFGRFELIDEHGQPFDVERLPGRLALQGKEAPETLIGVRPKGSAQSSWSLLKATALRSDDGKVQWVINVFHDVTELRQAIRARDEFLSIASHELRSPVMALQLVGELILQRVRAELGQAPPWLTDRLGDLVGQVQRVGALIDNLLDVTRLTEGRLGLQLEEIDATAVVRDSVARHAGEAARMGSTFNLRAGQPVVGRWDRLRLDQIVSNLVENAIRYGGGKPIDVVVEGDERSARLVVADHGIGIAPEDQRRIFERFERAVSPHQGGGLGLGLWIVRQIVEALGGTIGVASLPSAGATFTVALPRSGPAR